MCHGQLDLKRDAILVSQGAPGGGTGTVAMLEQMMRDPAMQKMLYPYLPEPMQNPETFEWMLNNPESRKQLEQMVEQQVRITAWANEGHAGPLSRR